MTARQVGSWLLFLGILGAIGSIIWWQNFYTQVDHFLNQKGAPPFECLYQLTGPCRMVANVAGFFGAGAYDPRLLWASGIAIVIGFFLRR